MLVGVIGLGRMGTALARRLRSKDFDIVVWNRNREKAEKLVKEIGGEVASSPRDVAERADYTHVIVSDDAALFDVTMGPSGVLEAASSTVLINHVTCTIRASVTLAEKAKAKTFPYVEAPIIGGPSVLEKGDAIILCSGDESYCSAESIAALGDVIYLGNPPRALAAKLGFNHIILSIVSSLADAFGLVEAHGIAWENFVNLVLSKTWLKNVVDRYGERFKLRGKPSFAARLAAKDALYVANALVEKGLDSSLAAAVANHYAAMVREGYAEEDYPAVAEFFARYGRGLRKKLRD